MYHSLREKCVALLLMVVMLTSILGAGVLAEGEGASTPTASAQATATSAATTTAAPTATVAATAEPTATATVEATAEPTATPSPSFAFSQEKQTVSLTGNTPVKINVTNSSSIAADGQKLTLRFTVNGTTYAKNIVCMPDGKSTLVFQFSLPDSVTESGQTLLLLADESGKTISKTTLTWTAEESDATSEPDKDADAGDTVETGDAQEPAETEAAGEDPASAQETPAATSDVKDVEAGGDPSAPEATPFEEGGEEEPSEPADEQGDLEEEIAAVEAVWVVVAVTLDADGNPISPDDEEDADENPESADQPETIVDVVPVDESDDIDGDDIDGDDNDGEVVDTDPGEGEEEPSGDETANSEPNEEEEADIADSSKEGSDRADSGEDKTGDDPEDDDIDGSNATDDGVTNPPDEQEGEPAETVEPTFSFATKNIKASVGDMVTNAVHGANLDGLESGRLLYVRWYMDGQINTAPLQFDADGSPTQSFGLLAEEAGTVEVELVDEDGMVLDTFEITVTAPASFSLGSSSDSVVLGGTLSVTVSGENLDSLESDEEGLLQLYWEGESEPVKTLLLTGDDDASVQVTVEADESLGEGDHVLELYQGSTLVDTLSVSFFAASLNMASFALEVDGVEGEGGESEGDPGVMATDGVENKFSIVGAGVDGTQGVSSQIGIRYEGGLTLYEQVYLIYYFGGSNNRASYKSADSLFNVQADQGAVTQYVSIYYPAGTVSGDMTVNLEVHRGSIGSATDAVATATMTYKAASSILPVIGFMDRTMTLEEGVSNFMANVTRTLLTAGVCEMRYIAYNRTQDTTFGGTFTLSAASDVQTPYLVLPPTAVAGDKIDYVLYPVTSGTCTVDSNASTMTVYVVESTKTQVTFNAPTTTIADTAKSVELTLYRSEHSKSSGLTVNYRYRADSAGSYYYGTTTFGENAVSAVFSAPIPTGASKVVYEILEDSNGAYVFGQYSTISVFVGNAATSNLVTFNTSYQRVDGENTFDVNVTLAKNGTGDQLPVTVYYSYQVNSGEEVYQSIQFTKYATSAITMDVVNYAVGDVITFRLKECNPNDAVKYDLGGQLTHTVTIDKLPEPQYYFLLNGQAANRGETVTIEICVDNQRYIKSAGESLYLRWLAYETLADGGINLVERIEKLTFTPQQSSLTTQTKTYSYTAFVSDARSNIVFELCAGDSKMTVLDTHTLTLRAAVPNISIGTTSTISAPQGSKLTIPILRSNIASGNSIEVYYRINNTWGSFTMPAQSSYSLQLDTAGLAVNDTTGYTFELIGNTAGSEYAVGSPSSAKVLITQPASFSIRQDAYTATKGNNVTLYVTCADRSLLPSTGQTVYVQWQDSDGIHPAGSETVRSATFYKGTGSQTQTITIPTTLTSADTIVVYLFASQPSANSIAAGEYVSTAVVQMTAPSTTVSISGTSSSSSSSSSSSIGGREVTNVRLEYDASIGGYRLVYDYVDGSGSSSSSSTTSTNSREVIEGNAIGVSLTFNPATKNPLTVYYNMAVSGQSGTTVGSYKFNSLDSTSGVMPIPYGGWIAGQTVTITLIPYASLNDAQKATTSPYTVGSSSSFTWTIVSPTGVANAAGFVNASGSPITQTSVTRADEDLTLYIAAKSSAMVPRDVWVSTSTTASEGKVSATMNLTNTQVTGITIDKSVRDFNQNADSLKLYLWTMISGVDTVVDTLTVNLTTPTVTVGFQDPYTVSSMQQGVPVRLPLTFKVATLKEITVNYSYSVKTGSVVNSTGTGSFKVTPNDTTGYSPEITIPGALSGNTVTITLTSGNGYALESTAKNSKDFNVVAQTGATPVYSLELKASSATEKGKPLTLTITVDNASSLPATGREAIINYMDEGVRKEVAVDIPYGTGSKDVTITPTYTSDDVITFALLVGGTQMDTCPVPLTTPTPVIGFQSDKGYVSNKAAPKATLTFNTLSYRQITLNYSVQVMNGTTVVSTTNATLSVTADSLTKEISFPTVTYDPGYTIEYTLKDGTGYTAGTAATATYTVLPVYTFSFAKTSYSGTVGTNLSVGVTATNSTSIPTNGQAMLIAEVGDDGQPVLGTNAIYKTYTHARSSSSTTVSVTMPYAEVAKPTIKLGVFMALDNGGYALCGTTTVTLASANSTTLQMSSSSMYAMAYGSGGMYDNASISIPLTYSNYWSGTAGRDIQVTYKVVHTRSSTTLKEREFTQTLAGRSTDTLTVDYGTGGNQFEYVSGDKLTVTITSVNANTLYGTVSLGTTKTCAVTIIAPTFSFSATSYSATAGGNAISLGAKVNSASYLGTNTVKVAFRDAQGRTLKTTTSGSDELLSFTDGTELVLSLNSSTTTAYRSVKVPYGFEGNATSLTLYLYNYDTGEQLTTTTAKLSISYPTVGFGTTAYTMGTSGTANITVSRSTSTVVSGETYSIESSALIAPITVDLSTVTSRTITLSTSQFNDTSKDAVLYLYRTYGGVATLAGTTTIRFTSASAAFYLASSAVNAGIGTAPDVQITCTQPSKLTASTTLNVHRGNTVIGTVTFSSADGSSVKTKSVTWNSSATWRTLVSTDPLTETLDVYNGADVLGTVTVTYNPPVFSTGTVTGMKLGATGTAQLNVSNVNYIGSSQNTTATLAVYKKDGTATGWTVKPASLAISSAMSQTTNIQITVPSAAEEGEYELCVTANGVTLPGTRAFTVPTVTTVGGSLSLSVMDTTTDETSQPDATAEEQEGAVTVSFANGTISSVRLSGNTASLPLSYSAQNSGLTGAVTYSYTINDKTYNYGSSVAVYLTGSDETVTFDFSEGIQNALANGETVSTVTVTLGTPTGGYAKGTRITCVLNIVDD